MSQLAGCLAELGKFLEPGYASFPTGNILRSGFAGDLVPAMR